MDPNDLTSGGFEVLAAHAPLAERVVRAEAEMRRFTMESLGSNFGGGGAGGVQGGYQTRQGVACIPIIGSLVPRGPVWMSRYGVTSYEAIRSELRRAASDDEVSTIILTIDSGGGYVSGVDTAGDAILAARRKKPVIAVVEGTAASAAYWLASQADRIIASSVSELGSIGVVLLHVDISRSLDAAGLKVTVIHAGSQKANASPFAPLPDAVREDIQRKLEKSRITFATAVVNGRQNPALDLKAVLDTEAAMFGADEAIAIGLADTIGNLDDLLDALPTAAAMRRPALGTGRLAEAPIAIEAPPAISAQARVTGAGSLPLAAVAPPPAARLVSADSAASAARERIGAILQHEWSQGDCRAFAEHIAFKTDFPVAQAIETLRINFETVQQTKLNSAPRRLTLSEEMAADPATAIAANVGADGGPNPHNFSETQTGAFKAAILFGRNPVEAAMKAGGAPSFVPAAPPALEPHNTSATLDSSWANPSAAAKWRGGA